MNNKIKNLVKYWTFKCQKKLFKSLRLKSYCKKPKIFCLKIEGEVTVT